MNLLIGLRLLLPDPILSSNPSYRFVSHFTHGDIPAGIFLLITGIVMVSGLLTDRLPWLNDVALWFSFLFWVGFAFAIGKANVSQIGSVAYLVIAAMYGYAYFHLLQWREQQERRTPSR